MQNMLSLSGGLLQSPYSVMVEHSPPPEHALTSLFAVQEWGDFNGGFSLLEGNWEAGREGRGVRAGSSASLLWSAPGEAR